MSGDAVSIVVLAPPAPAFARNGGSGADVVAEMVRHSIETARKARDGRDQQLELIVAYASESERAMQPPVGDDVAVATRTGASLVERMGDVFARRSVRLRPVLVVRAEAPDVTGPIIVEALDAMHRAQLVIGPATDGGYYLLGGANLPATPLSGMPSASHDLLARTLAAARQLALRVHVLDILRTMDDADMWIAWSPPRRRTVPGRRSGGRG